MAAPRPTAPSTLGVPASNFQGRSFQVDFSGQTARIISPPPIQGGIAPGASPCRRGRRCPWGRTSCGPRRRRSRSRGPARPRGSAAPTGRRPPGRARRARARSGNGLHVVDGAQHVGDVREGHQAGARVPRALGGFQVEAAVRVDGDECQRQPRRAQASCQGTRLLWCSISVRSTTSPSFRNLSAPGGGHEVDRLRGAPGEDDLRASSARSGSAGPFPRFSSKAAVASSPRVCRARCTFAFPCS